MYDNDIFTYMLARIKWNCPAMCNTMHTTTHMVTGHWPLFTVAEKPKWPVACGEKMEDGYCENLTSDRSEHAKGSMKHSGVTSANKSYERKKRQKKKEHKRLHK